MQKKYDITDYDANLCLRVSPLMWVSMLFLFRAYLIGLLSVVNFNDRMALINMLYSNHWQLSLGALAGIPVLVVLYAWRGRKPEASVRTQWIWRNGRSFLVTSAALNIVALFLPILTGISRHMDGIGQAQVALCGAVLVFLFISKRVPDTFSDFPRPELIISKMSGRR
jgi:hypothetical protein